MSNSSEIVAMLRTSELRQSIVRSLCSSTVALFALFPGKGGARLELAGSGTLVFTGKSHCILTAAHVWEKVLKNSAKIGIELTDNISHRCLFATVTMAPTVLKPDSGWSEWGPDLALLRIPPHRVGGIKAFKVFEDVKTPTKAPDFKTIGGWVAIGAPAELGSFTSTHAVVQVSGRFVDPEYHKRSPYDYYDFKLDTTAPQMPSTFGGMSGGGLWKVLVYCSPKTGQIDWVQRLKGVIYYEFPPQNGFRVIRCNGPQSVKAVSEMQQ